MAAKRKSYAIVTPEQFVRIWQDSDSPAHVAKRLGLPYNNVCSRAGYYKKKGIKLKSFRNKHDSLNVSALNAIIHANGK